MSMWPNGFEDPVKHKQDFPELKDKGEYQTKALSPIKSAPNYATSHYSKTRWFKNFIDSVHYMVDPNSLKII